MKYKTLLILILLFSTLNCRRQQTIQNAQAGQSEQADSTAANSSAAADLWTLYSYDERRGMQLFNRYCTICHGEKGEGDGFNSYTLNPRPHSMADSAYMTRQDDAALEQIISFGGRGVNRSILMPAYFNTLSKSDISYLVKYIRTFLRDNTAVE